MFEAEGACRVGDGSADVCGRVVGVCVVLFRVFVIALAVVVLPSGLGPCIASVAAIVSLTPSFVGSVWLIGVVWVVI